MIASYIYKIMINFLLNLKLFLIKMKVRLLIFGYPKGPIDY